MNIQNNQTNSDNITKIILPVKGLSCASCASSVESMLKSQDGVKEVNVNFADKSALIKYDSDKINIPDMQKVIKSIGYELIDNTLIDNSKEKHYNEHTHSSMSGDSENELKKKFWVSVFFSIPLFIIGMVFHKMNNANYIMLGLSLPVIFYSGIDFYIRAFKQALHFKSNMDSLVALGTGAAFILSVVNTFYPDYLINNGIEVTVYFESAAIIISLLLLGKYFEAKATGKTSEALKKLINLQPKTAIVIRIGKEEEIPISEIVVGDIILIKPGQNIPVDGVVTDGFSVIDESAVTGEPLPVEKKTGDNVISGSINKSGSFKMKAVKVGSESMLSKIIELVREAQTSKAPLQKIADKISSVFVPVVMVISVITFIAWMLLAPSPAFPHAFITSVTVLVIACPCALGLATPTAIMVGIGKAANNGVLFKNAESLEKLKEVNSILLDKTGTITEGKPQVISQKWFVENQEFKNSLNILYSIESLSEHPLAKAITDKLHSENPEKVNVTNFQNIPGGGIIAEVNSEKYFIGSDIFISQKINFAVDISDSQTGSLVYFSDSKNVLAQFIISDKVKDTSKKAISALQANGLEIFMATGDNKKSAIAIASQVGIPEYDVFAGVTPDKKNELVKLLQIKEKKVAMVGDGINDSPALAQADVGIAIGSGTDIAIESAEVVLIKSDLMNLVFAFKISKDTVRTIKENLFWAFIYNVIGIPIAAGILYPINGFLLNPMIAGAAMAFSSVSVVLNSLRLKAGK
ncbi:MAG TPA: heavy metal translocating P-type ATPase [Ignavibacteria bacterium]|nr:heavy metal translocating P-type ATPase [Ignavibacteria bacterium]